MIDLRVLQMTRDKKISLEALAYWTYQMSRSNWIREWAVTEANRLGVTPRVIERLRKELRDAGLLVTIRLGQETYTSTIACPFEEDHLTDSYNREVFHVQSKLYKERWLIEKELKMTPEDRGRGLEYGFENLGNPFQDPGFILRRPYIACLTKVMPRCKGVERLKAMGLWVLLAVGQPSYRNWQSPRHIALTLDLHRHTVTKLCSHLNILGLFYYEPKKNAVGISLFPTGNWERLHPTERLRKYRPWRWFAGGASEL